MTLGKKRRGAIKDFSMPCPSLKPFLRHPRASGIRRVVVAAALAFAFVLGAVAATAVRTAGVQASDLHEIYTSTHKHENVQIDKHGPHAVSGLGLPGRKTL